LDEYKSLVIVFNKWDALEKDSNTINEFRDKVKERMHFIPYAPVIFISALTGQRIHEVLEVANRVYEARHFRLQTAEVNRVLRDAIQKHPAPLKGTKRLKIYFGTQVSTAPPIFLLHVNDKSLVHFSYRRYLENQFRQAFPFEGTPIRISFRQREGLDD